MFKLFELWLIIYVVVKTSCDTYRIIFVVAYDYSCSCDSNITKIGSYSG